MEYFSEIFREHYITLHLKNYKITAYSTENGLKSRNIYINTDEANIICYYNWEGCTLTNMHLQPNIYVYKVNTFRKRETFYKKTI